MQRRADTTPKASAEASTARSASTLPVTIVQYVGFCEACGLERAHVYVPPSKPPAWVCIACKRPESPEWKPHLVPFAVPPLGRDSAELLESFRHVPLDDFQGIEQLPTHPREAALRSVALTTNLVHWWLDKLSPQDQAVLKQHLDRNLDNLPALQLGEVRNRIFAKLDDLLFALARTIGPTLFTSGLALNRAMQWWWSEPDGHQRIQKFASAWISGALVNRGLAKAPLDQAMPEFKRQIKAEIRTLQERLLAQLNVMNHQPTRSELFEMVCQLVTDPSERFDWLGPRWTLLRMFLERNPDMLNLLASRTIKPARFTDELMAWATHRSPEKLPKQVSELAGKRKRP